MRLVVVVLAGTVLVLLTAAGTAAAQNCKARQVAQSQGRPPAAVTKAFGVLRRPQRERDRLSATLQRHGPLTSVLVRQTRYLGKRAGSRFHLVPGRSASLCSSERPKPYVCLVERRDGTNGSRWLCTPARSVAAPAFGARGYAADDGLDRSTIAGLIPDGVAAVQAKFADGSERTVRVRRNLFAFTVVRPQADRPTSPLPVKLRHLAADGSVLLERP